MKGLSIEIPEDVIVHLRLPPRNLEQELKKELAVHLYAEGLLPQASACRLAGMNRLAFAHLLGERQIPVRYTSQDLDQDLQTLGELK
jgi:predicted HTH domain antitoxin